MSNILETLWQKLNDNSTEIEEFFSKKFRDHPALVYNSCDLRHSGFKICPVDTNCFPAGFNNLGEKSKILAKEVANTYFDENFADARKIIIIPENHTRNTRYLANILDLAEILSDSREVVVGTLISEVDKSLILDVDDNRKLTLEKIINVDGKIRTTSGFEADLVVLNNDLTDGISETLQNLQSTIVPAINLGWHKRTKSTHFDIYNSLAKELADIIEIDPWLISSIHESCDEVNFKEQTGLDCLQKKVDKVILELKEKYQQYGINENPYVYVKADNGTYGMAIWTVSSGQEILEINKKNRNKMNVIKGSIQNTKVMIQEGVKTIDTINNNVAEPMIYMINATIVGNLFRVNEGRNEKSSLNAPGASFFDLNDLDDQNTQLGLTKDRAPLIYSVVSRLAALATAIENKNNS
ncbi:MAG: glutamate--cysteine ligase [Rickettsiales bacterium]|nr:glutamate--cysteine ligase [Rickettsiales bacterium]